MYKAFKLQPHPCTLYNNKNLWLFKKTFFFSKPDIVLNISSNEFILKHSYWNNFKEGTQGSFKQDKCNRCVLTLEPSSIYIFIKVKRWKLAIKWCKFYSDINFFLLNNHTKITTQFMTTHLTVIAFTWSQKTAHFSPKHWLKKPPPTYEFPITKNLMELIPYLFVFIHLM